MCTNKEIQEAYKIRKEIKELQLRERKLVEKIKSNLNFGTFKFKNLTVEFLKVQTAKLNKSKLIKDIGEDKSQKYFINSIIEKLSIKEN